MNPMLLGPLARIVEEIIDRVIPDREGRAKAKQELEMEMLKRRTEIIEAAKSSDAGQVEINKIEAADPSLFKSGWRPAMGWVGVFALSYQFVLRPFLTWLSPELGLVNPPPVLDLGDLLTLLAGMLGLGTLRTVEKTKGVA